MAEITNALAARLFNKDVKIMIINFRQNPKDYLPKYLCVKINSINAPAGTAGTLVCTVESTEDLQRNDL